MGFLKKNKTQHAFEPQYTSKVPVVPFKILENDIPIYADQECRQQIEGARILILLALDPNEKVVEEEIVPTRIQYQKGQYVTWSFNSKKVWEDCWYRDPRSGLIARAWGLHVEFAGEVLSPEAVAQHQDHFNRLEEQTLKRLQEKEQREVSSTSVH